MSHGLVTLNRENEVFGHSFPPFSGCFCLGQLAKSAVQLYHFKLSRIFCQTTWNSTTANEKFHDDSLVVLNLIKVSA